MGPVQHFTVKIERPGWTDFDEVELPRPPNDGETIETKFGVCVVTQTDLPTSSEQQDGTILCRLP